MILRQNTMPQLDRTLGHGTLTIDSPEWMSATDRPCAPDADGKIRTEFGAENRKRQNDAKKLCNQQCPYQQQCLSWAVDADESYGIWGGVNFASHTERARATGRRPRREIKTTEGQTDEEIVEIALASNGRFFAKLTTQQKALTVAEGLRRGIAMGNLARRFSVKAIDLYHLVGDTPGAGLDAEVRRLYDKDRTDLEIAVALDIHPRTVQNSRSVQGLKAKFGPGGRRKHQEPPTKRVAWA
jgi:hypothetical protein